MSAVKESLAAELAPIQKQIEQTRGKLRLLEGELRNVLAEIESFSADKQRFDALRDVCTALDALGELGASNLFWDGLPGDNDVAGHLNLLRDRIGQFESEIRGTQEKHASLKAKINKQHYELNFLHEEVRQAYAREERRNEDLLIEREVTPMPYRAMIMPWTSQEEDEKRFRLALVVALSFCIFFGTLIPLWKLPMPDRLAAVEVPERLVSLVKKEPPKPALMPERLKENKKPEKDQEKELEKSKEDRPKQTAAGTQAARKKAESTGVLAFKGTFRDLMDETPVARLGAEARLSKQSAVAAGQARASRSIISVQSIGGSSGGIGNAGISRNVGRGSGSGGGGGDGGNGPGGVGFTRVVSSVAGLEEEARPLSSGPSPARTDEEIQIVFDKYKATLYRIYNAQLRKDPTLRGKMILRITIEPGGEVSFCSVQSTDLASPQLISQILERVRRFNFGPKETVPKTTILYPIDFLPGG
jgi:hypothetical protein